MRRMNAAPRLPAAEKRAEDLADSVARATASDRPHAFRGAVIEGEPGAGKTAVLDFLTERLRGGDVAIPIRVTPPERGLDVPLHGLAQIAGALREHSVNGVLDPVFDPSCAFPYKLDATLKGLNEQRQADTPVVVLVDVPDRWLDARHEDPASWLAASRGIDMLRRLVAAANAPHCFVFLAATGSVRGVDLPSQPLYARSSGGEFLRDPDRWREFTRDANRLREAIPDLAPQLTPLALRMAVALLVLQLGIDAVRMACEGGRAELARLLGEEVRRRSELRQAWAALALARFAIDQDLVDTLTSGLRDRDRELLLRVCLLHDGSGWTMHPSLRGLARDRRASDPAVKDHELLARGWKARALQPREKRDDTIAWLEQFHHYAAAGKAAKVGGAPDVTYFTSLGRSLSRAGDYSGAIEAYRTALEYRPTHAYAQEYLAYNLDRVGKKLPEGEAAFAKAVEVEPTNPWWNRRYVQALARRGKINAAHKAWLAALRNVPGAAEPDEWLQRNLFAGVAEAFLRRGEEELAAQVIESVPAEARCRELLAHYNRVLHRREARELGGPIFPESLPFLRRWDGPTQDTGMDPRYWYPGRVLHADERDVTLELAEPPQNEDDKPQVFRITLGEEVFRREASLPAARKIVEGTLLEVHVSADDQRAIAFTDMARPKAHTEGLDLLANWPPDDDQ